MHGFTIDNCSYTHNLNSCEIKAGYIRVYTLRSDEGLTLETSALYSLRWPIYIFNLVDITKLPCYPH